MNTCWNIGLALAAAVSIVAARPAQAIQASVAQIDSNSDGTKTYHFTVTLDAGEKLTPGSGAAADFVTIYNFYGLVDGTPKAPDGWTFTSEEFGRTPTLNGYPMVLPVDVPNTPNLTFTATKPMTAGSMQGFTATTRSAVTVEGEYSAQITRDAVAVKGAPAGTTLGQTSKQAVLGMIPTPGFLAPVK